MSTPHDSGSRKSLPANPSVESLKKQAKQLAKSRPELSLQRAQRQLANSYGFANWDALLLAVEYARRDAAKALPALVESGAFAPYRQFRFTLQETGDASPDMAALQFTIDEVYGTSRTIAVGERYVMRGKYDLAGTIPFSLSLAVFNKAFGAGAHLRPGIGRFDLSMEVLALADRGAPVIGLIVTNDRTGKSRMVRVLTVIQ